MSETISAPVGALSPAEAGRYLGGFTVGTLANWRSRGDGPPWTKVCGRVIYRIVDLDAFLAENVVGGAA